MSPEHPPGHDPISIPRWKSLKIADASVSSPSPLNLKSLLYPLDSRKPADTVLSPMLLSWPKPGLMQRKVVNSANAQDAHSRKALANTVHERTAVLAEVVGHRLARSDRLGLAKRLETVLPARVLKVGVLDGEVAGEHGRGDLAAVGAVADKGVDDAVEGLFVGSYTSALIFRLG